MELLVLKHFLFRPPGTPAFLAADLLIPFLFGRLPAKDKGFDLVCKDPPGKEPVQRLRAGLLAFDLDAGRYMFQINAR